MLLLHLAFFRRAFGFGARASMSRRELGACKMCKKGETEANEVSAAS